ncbi:MAG: DUF2169 domain-containing protein [Minicystis sp.]
MRIVVVEPPPAGSAWLARGPLSVGAFDWRDPDPVATVVVKVTYDIGGDRPVLAAEQRWIEAGNVAALEADLWGEVFYPSDLAPHKPEGDVLVVGHAFAVEREAREIPVRIAVGSMTREVLARGAAPADRIPLSRSHLLTMNGEHPERVGPERIPADKSSRALASDHDYRVFNAAPEEQRRAWFEPGEEVRLSGLSPRGERVFALPLERPRVQAAFRGPMPDAELQMIADTLWIDTDRAVMVLVWRGMLGLLKAGMVERIAVSLEPADTARPWAEILRSAARGAFSMSASPDDPSMAPKDDEERDRIAAARADLHARGAAAGAGALAR